jgi:hypothetical protein
MLLIPTFSQMPCCRDIFGETAILRSQGKREAIRCCHYIDIARWHQDELPLEQTGYGRRAISSDRLGYMRDTGFDTGARRFDMVERNFISFEMPRRGDELLTAGGTVVPYRWHLRRLRLLRANESERPPQHGQDRSGCYDLAVNHRGDCGADKSYGRLATAASAA